MKESDIRPSDLAAEVYELYKIEKERILAKIGNFVKVNCPACNDKKNILLFKKEGFTFVKCVVCETVYVNPRPTKEMLFEYYKTSLSGQFWSEKIYPKSEEARVKHLVLPRVKKIIDLCDKYNIPTDSIMDVGAGFGTFCEQMQRTGKFKEVIAVEPEANVARICVEKGLHVVEDFIENMHSKKVNVITSIESIEHIFEPREYINGIYEKLATGGLLFITTPNIKGFDIVILQDKSRNIQAPSHLNYFNPKSISVLLEDNGFEILEIKTPGKLDAELVRKKVLDGSISLDERPFLKHILIDEYKTYIDSFQQWLASNGMSSHMSVVARKK